MTLIDRIKAAGAAFRAKDGGGNTSSERLTLTQLLDWLGVHDVSGEALSEATYFACLKVLSEALGKLPLKIQQTTEANGVRIAWDHPFFRVLNTRPNRYMTAATFWSTMELCRNHYGNAYAWIDSRDVDAPQLWPIDPSSVQVIYDNARRLSDVPDVYYRVSTAAGQVIFGSEEILHFKSHLTLDGLVGISVREQLAGTIQGGVKAQTMLNRLYDTGLTAKAVLQYTGGLDDKKVEVLSKGVEDYLKGRLKDKGVENVIPVPIGMSLTPLNLKLSDAQFNEIRQASALQIASAFGVRPYQIGDYTKSSYANAEAQQLSFLLETLLYILTSYEQEIAYKILFEGEAAAGYHVKFNTGVLLRSDLKSQIEALSTATSTFLMTPNEAREKLDLPGKEGGDQLIGNGSTIPITAVGTQWQATE